MNHDHNRPPSESPAAGLGGHPLDAAGPAPPGPSPLPGGDEPPRSRKRWIASAAVALGVALFAVPLVRTPEPVHSEEGRADAVTGTQGRKCAASRGDAKFDITLKDADGADVRLSEYKGKVVLLNFWATWCGPCKVEIPEFVEAYSRYRDRGFVILGVLSQDDPPPPELRAFTSMFGMNYPVFRESEQLEEAFGSLWALPTSFIIDRQGAICTKHMGPVSKEMLEREIRGLL